MRCEYISLDNVLNRRILPERNVEGPAMSTTLFDLVAFSEIHQWCFQRIERYKRTQRESYLQTRVWYEKTGRDVGREKSITDGREQQEATHKKKFERRSETDFQWERQSGSLSWFCWRSRCRPFPQSDVESADQLRTPTTLPRSRTS